MKLRLKHKILLLYAVVCACIIILVGTVLALRLREEKLTDIHRNFNEQLTHIEFAFNSFFKNLESDLKDITPSDLVRTKDDKDFTNFTKADEAI